MECPLLDPARRASDGAGVATSPHLLEAVHFELRAIPRRQRGLSHCPIRSARTERWLGSAGRATQRIKKHLSWLASELVVNGQEPPFLFIGEPTLHREVRQHVSNEPPLLVVQPSAVTGPAEKCYLQAALRGGCFGLV